MSILSDELTNDPLSRGYSGMDDEAAAADIMTVYRDGEVPEREIKLQLMRQQTYSGICDARNDTGHAGHAVAVMCYELLNDNDRADIDVTDADIVTQLAALVATGLLTQANSDEITALKNNRRSRADELGLSNVRAGTVARARA